MGERLAPAWRCDGREIYYLTPTGTLKVVTVDAKSGNFKSAVPQNLFDFDINGLYAASRLYPPSADGQRFLITQRKRRTDAVAVEPLTVVVDWVSDIERAR